MPEMPLLGGTPTRGLGLFISEFLITITTGDVWLAIGLALLLGAGCLAFGIWLSRAVGLLRSDAPAGEVLGVGLGTGLIVIAAWWAAFWSGGRSSFTPVAIGFALAVGLAVVRRLRRTADAAPESEVLTPPPRRDRQALVVTVLAGGAFIVAIALLYGSTMAPSPRDGLQPVEFNDQSFYAVLGRDLATTGTETNLLPSGFDELPGLPAQTWYHWAELWLASAVITIFGTAPMAARYLVVLPLVLLAAAALTGTLVRRLAGTSSHRAYLFGFLACLFLAPIPVPGPYFSSWATGLIFGINFYGLAAVAVVLALYAVAVLGTKRATWTLGVFVGSAFAFIMPAHIVIAALAIVGIDCVWALRVLQSIAKTRRIPIVPPVWQRTFVSAGALFVATIIWASMTGHGLGGTGTAASPTITAFSGTWQFTIAFIYVGAGALLAIPVGALFFRMNSPGLAGICVATVGLVIAGAIAWGARLADFNMYHVFFGGIAVFGAPVGAAAAWKVYESLGRSRHRILLRWAIILGLFQLGVGIAMATVRLQEFGPRLHHQPIPIAVLAAIEQLPADAKLAYVCRPFEEFAFTDPSLLAIDAHTGRRVVPMCFEADVFSTLNGAPPLAQAPSSGFSFAPQFSLYPDVAARPSTEAVLAFLKSHDIHYIYADGNHPNSLVPDAIVIASSGDAAVLVLPGP